MKKLLLLIMALCLFLAGCSQPAKSPATDSSPAVTLTDCVGRQVLVTPEPKRVVGLSSSMAEIWLLAGGTLSGVTDDAKNEREMDVGDATVVGTIKKPSAEAILALEPDLVIYSADISAHLEIEKMLTQSGIPCYGAKVERFEDYLKVLSDLTELTGREDLYQQNGAAIQGEIAGLRARVPEGKAPTVLYLRAYSSGVKVKARDNVACDILEDVGAVNVADGNPALEELNIEAIVKADPDFIFAVTMGDEEAAKEELERTLCANPAWEGLSAVKNGGFHLLPKELYHYKPNARWGEAYEYLLEILWPESYGQA